LLRTAVLFAAAACAPRIPEQEVSTPAPLPDAELWTQEAHGILSDVLNTLRTYDDFQAFRVSTSSGSPAHLAAELAWDAPTSAAWDEATHVTRGLHGRADHLFSVVTGARVDPSLWRNQRTLADATHDLVDLGDALRAYRDRVDVLPPGDAAGALTLLDQTWTQWDAAAARWGTSRAEFIGCASAPTPMPG
jgi:hypothetical protein